MTSIMLANLSYSLPDTYAPPVAPPFHFHDLLWRLIIWTVFLMALCLLVLLVSKARRRFRLASQTNSLRLQAVVPLSYRARLYLVQVEEQTVAVVSDAGGLRTLILLSPVFADSLAHAATAKLAASKSLETSQGSLSAHPTAEDILSSTGSLPTGLPIISEKKAA
jgi:flagellar biogenesis protein FliO